LSIPYSLAGSVFVATFTAPNLLVVVATASTYGFYATDGNQT
jgi:hypothetical protein